MNEAEIKAIIKKQKDFFRTGATLSVTYRIEALKKLKKLIQENEEQICAALKSDLGKSTSESYMCEVGLTLSEISYMLAHVKKFAKERNVATPLAQFASRSYVKPVPYGQVLIMSPWNYPFLLTMEPLVNAIAAGNTCVLKPSAYSQKTTEIMTRLIARCFDEKYVAVITGGRAENTCLLTCEFDYIFFTGSQAVGKEVLRRAAEHLTPATLELGGKSPCIVDETANVKLAARRIVFGKYLNCGQTCVAPDYLYCHENVKEELLEHIKKEIKRQFGEEPLANNNYGRIINEKHFTRIMGLIDPKKVIAGGSCDKDALRIEPTVLDNVTWEDAVMQEEIFGPLLPVLTFTSLDEVLDIVGSKPHPLAGYFFSENKKAVRRFTSTVQYGGGCINDVVIHLATSNMGFGGVGASGMGSYHGKCGFDTFSHKKSIVDKKTWLDLPMRYQPYSDLYDKMIRMFLK